MSMPAPIPPAQTARQPADMLLAAGSQWAQWWSGLRSQTGTWLCVLVGKFVLMGANATLMLLLAAHFALETYGLLVTLISAQLFISRVLMLGVDAGMIRMRTIPALHQQVPAIVLAGLVVIGYATAAFLLCALAAAWLWPASAASPWPNWALAAVVIGAVGTALVDYNYGFHLAQLQYRAAVVVQSGTALVRLVTTMCAVWFLPQDTATVFLSYTGVSCLSGVVQTATLLRRQGQWPARALVWRLFRYSWWQGGANIVAVFSLYQGTFLLAALNTRAATSIFGLGLTLSLGFFAVYNACTEYLMPRVARLEHAQALVRFLMRACGGTCLLTMVCGLVASVVGTLVPLLCRPELHAVVPIFYLLSASMLLLILQCPFEVACHYLLRPQWVMLAWVLRALSIALLGLALVPSKGAAGMALAQLAGTVLAFLALGVFVVTQTQQALRRHTKTGS